MSRSFDIKLDKISKFYQTATDTVGFLAIGCSHGAHAFTDCGTVSYHFRIWLKGQRQDNLL